MMFGDCVLSLSLPGNEEKRKRLRQRKFEPLSLSLSLILIYGLVILFSLFFQLFGV
jgi:hypothetical protein